MEPSMSRTGNGWDHAGAERCFHTFTTDWVYLENVETHEQAQREVLA
jgi:transposase InsO family protein